MKKTISVVFAAMVAAIIVFILAGCGSPVIVQATPTTLAPTTLAPTTLPPTTLAPTTTAAPLPADPQKEFLALIEENTSLLMVTDPYELLETGSLVCEFYSSGGTTDEIIEILINAVTQSGSTEAMGLDYASLVAIAVNTLCPENAAKV